MKILYISQYYPPEIGAPAARVSELARHWVKEGHQVTVLTGFPNHPTGIVPPEYRSKLSRLVYREQMSGVDVVRTWLFPCPNRKVHERLLNYLSFVLSACITGIFLRKPHIIIATSPQLFVGLIGRWLGWLKRVPFTFEVRDLWPESITASGIGRETDFSIRVLHGLSSFLYRFSDHIVVVTRAFKDQLVDNWQVPVEKLSVVENGVEARLFDPVGPKVSFDRGTDNKFIVSYIGTLGLAHGLETLIKAASHLQNVSVDIHFLCIGEGAEKERLYSLVSEHKLQNMSFLPQQPRDQIPAIIRASHVCLVLLKKAPVFETVIPTKMLEFMACGRPIILGVNGQAREIVEAAKAGICIEPEDCGALASAVTRLYMDVELREELGRNGREYIIKHLTRERTSATYMKVLESVLRNAGRMRNQSTSASGKGDDCIATSTE